MGRVGDWIKSAGRPRAGRRSPVPIKKRDGAAPAALGNRRARAPRREEREAEWIKEALDLVASLASVASFDALARPDQLPGETLRKVTAESESGRLLTKPEIRALSERMIGPILLLRFRTLSDRKRAPWEALQALHARIHATVVPLVDGTRPEVTSHLSTLDRDATWVVAVRQRVVVVERSKDVRDDALDALVDALASPGSNLPLYRCGWCRKVFYSDKNAVYCSADCHKDATRDKRREYMRQYMRARSAKKER